MQRWTFCAPMRHPCSCAQHDGRGAGNRRRLGVKFPIDVDRRIAGGRVGAHRTSMLQDLDQGRPMEIDALVASVQELGRVTGCHTHH